MISSLKEPCNKAITIVQALVGHMLVNTDEDPHELVRDTVRHVLYCPTCQKDLDERYSTTWRCILTGAVINDYLSKSRDPYVAQWVDTHVGQRHGCWCYANIMLMKFRANRVLRYNQLDEWLQRADELEKTLKEEKEKED